MSTRIRPIIGLPASNLNALTLRSVWADYQQARKLKPGSIKEYNRVIHTYLVDWLDRPLKDISKLDVLQHHQLLSRTRGPVQANIVLRVLRAMIFFAMNKYDDAYGNPLITSNPVVRALSGTKTWNKEFIRSGWIKPHEMPCWFATARKMKSPWDDYLVLLVLTGLRRTEAQTLRWADVDFTDKSINISDTKNGDTHQLPMSDYIFQLLHDRYEAQHDRYEAQSKYLTHGDRPRWVFPGSRTKSCFDAYALKTTNLAGFRPFIFHDLRRTFLTTAAGLDINANIVKQLANHRISRNDVTARYIVKNVESLRRPMQRITNEILRQAGLRADQHDQVEDKHIHQYHDRGANVTRTPAPIAGLQPAAQQPDPTNRTPIIGLPEQIARTDSSAPEPESAPVPKVASPSTSSLVSRFVQCGSTNVTVS